MNFLQCAAKIERINANPKFYVIFGIVIPNFRQILGLGERKIWDSIRIDGKGLGDVLDRSVIMTMN